MAFVLNIFRGEKKDNLGFLPRSIPKATDKKAKKNDLEDIADEFMRKEEYNVQADKCDIFVIEIVSWLNEALECHCSNVRFVKIWRYTRSNYK